MSTFVDPGPIRPTRHDPVLATPSFPRPPVAAPAGVPTRAPASSSCDAPDQEEPISENVTTGVAR